MKGARAACLAVVLFISGCQSVPPLAPPGGAVVSGEGSAVPVGTAMTSWRAVGRLAVKGATGGFNASFDWRQEGDTSDLSVHGPFGAGRSRVTIAPEHIRVEAGDSPGLDFSPPYVGIEQALRERVGFEVPLGSLRYWLMGVADPLEAFEVDPPSGFTQLGWHIQVDEPGVSVGDQALPKRLTLSRDDARIRVVFDRWETGG